MSAEDVRGVVVSLTIDFPKLGNLTPGELRSELADLVHEYFDTRGIDGRIMVRMLPYTITGGFERLDHTEIGGTRA